MSDSYSNADTDVGVHPLTEATFDQQVLNADRPVFVEFWAEWCGTCKAMAPVLLEMAEALGRQIHVATLDVEAYPVVADRYGILALPTMLLFHEGSIIGRVTGFVPKKKLLENLEAFLQTVTV